MKTDTKVILLTLSLSTAFILFVIFSAPQPPSFDLSLINAGSNIRETSASANTLVEFSDFFCPACKAAEPYIQPLLEKFAGRLRFIYRHFPLDQHPLAFKASQAAEAAAQQGKFWEYKEKLFAKQESLVEADFPILAEELGLDLNKFNQDLNSSAVIATVQKDAEAVRQLRLNSTPTFFLNGEKLSFDSFADFAQTVTAKLK